ncbi:HNH endonuclease domain-containing protein [Pseudomonas sp. RIT411]|uniref:HNH endonuclease domain-containing protein n=1 Tax=Pseudomonas sp. RIT411 TaxID=2202160 RepID=UPI000D336E16|nr:HNH endonuclease domain-containing protein [Pseudomonas sp. RIT 411]RAU42041.1 hypothetical protein DBY63_004845 [Pseudomonas sp. RIT 411]
MSAIPPSAASLNVGALSAIFDKTTASYKLLFFIGLLQLIENRLRRFDDDRTFALDEITAGLLSFGWYPHRFFKLSFGAQDQVGAVLDQLDFDLSERAVTSSEAQQALCDALAGQFDRIGAATLQRYVPQRLLTPFFADALRCLPDQKKDRRIRELAESTFTSDKPPLYRFVNGGARIEIHPRWMEYLTVNFSIIKGWAFNHWAAYLQRSNPNSPAIIDKIAPPYERASLTKQRKVWKQLLAELPLTCIYANDPVQPDTFDLDHFLPWSFICHDQYWNLIPAKSATNRSIGRTLPTPEQVEAFINVQIQALQVAQRLLSSKQWTVMAEDYSVGLGLSTAELVYPEKVTAAYTKTLNPMISLAQSLGY